MSTFLPLVMSTVADLRDYVAGEQAADRRVGLIPTMGALHEGHLSLVRAAQAECATTLVSIFVNPTQFGPTEDFRKYPRTLQADLAKLAECRTTAVFAPAAEEVYPPGCSTAVLPPEVARTLEGEVRPDHFQGVCTIVLKLFLMSRAEVAYFGQKDYQQAQVIRRMVADLNVPIAIRVCPIVREADGLAMSSRNAYLTADQRQQALGLSQSLRAANAAFLDGNSDPAAIGEIIRQTLRQHGIEQIDYVAALDPETLAQVARARTGTVVALAAHVGSTRLIDNWRLGVD
jgi:pantoate--beta-alanine ligase